MGKGDKKTGAASSKAAEMLAKSGGSRAQTGFGGFSGSAPVSSGGFAFGAKYISQVAQSPSQTDAAPGPSAIIPAELDGELSQQLQRLTKRDGTTRLKALQALRTLVTEKSDEDLRCMLSPWAYYFGRLVMDGNRTVRAEACINMGVIAGAAGRSMAPFIKFVYPYWFLAHRDESSEVVAAAKSSLLSAFPGDKAADVLLFCKTEVLNLLTENVSSTPQSLGDPTKETPEELQSRHERVLAATCSALAAVIEQGKKPSEEGKEKTAEARKQLLDGAQSLLDSPSFVKTMVQSKASSVRRRAYDLISSVCRQAPELVESEAALAVLAPAVYGSIGEKEPGNHSAMWGMVLSLASAHPSSWNAVNIQKAVLPKLWSLLRHACYGSAEGSYPAVLPFIALLYPHVLASNMAGSSLFQSLLSAVWDGALACQPGAAQKAAVECFEECFVYAMVKSDQAEEIIAQVLETKCLPMAVASSGGTLARGAVTGIVKKLSTSGDEVRRSKLELVTSAVGQYAAQATQLALEKPDAPGAPSFVSIGELVLGVGENATKPVVAALVPEIKSGGASAAATSLLASLASDLQALQMNDDEEHTTGFTVDGVVNRIIEERQSGAALDASCDLIVSCLGQQSAELGGAIERLVNGIGAAAGSILIKHFIASSSTNEGVAELDALCLESCSAAQLIDPSVEEFVELLILGNGRESLLTEAGQTAVLQALGDGISAANEEAFKIAALRLVEKCVFSTPVRADVARLHALEAVFEVLVEETCAAAALVDESDEDEERVHTQLYGLALSVWSPHKYQPIAEILSQVALDSQLGFVQSLSASISDAVHAFASPTAAAAGCAHAAWQVCAGTNHLLLRRTLLHSLRESLPQQPQFFMDVGRALGFDALLLQGFEETEACDVAVELLLWCHESTYEALTRSIVASPMLVTRVLDAAWQQGHSSVVGKLLQHAPSDVATAFFRNTIIVAEVDDEMSAKRVVIVLEAVAPMFRSSETLFADSNLEGFTLKLCEKALTDDLLIPCATACLPAPPVAPPVPLSTRDTGTAAAALSPGALVWYNHRDGSWEAAEIVNVDVSVQPPSYGVRLSTGVRETERARLKERKDDEPPPLNLHRNLEQVDDDVGMSVVVNESEKEAMLELFRTYNNNALVLRSAFAWCSRKFTQADWEQSFSALETHIKAISHAAACAANVVAAGLVDQATHLAGAPLGNAEASLAFFRQLRHKRVLQASEKGVEAGGMLNKLIQNELSSFNSVSGIMLVALLQSYCHAAHCVATSQSRTCPFTLWEQAQAVICAETLDIFISLGKIVALAAGCGQSLAVAEAADVQCWHQLSQVVDATVAAADLRFLTSVVESSNARIHTDGVGCTDALVALTLDSAAPESARDAAYRSILLHGSLISDLFRDTMSDDDVTDAIEKADWYEELERAGVLPEIANAAADPQHPSFLQAWGLVVAHILHAPESGTARGRLIERIKEAHGLVQSALDVILTLLPTTGGSGTTFGAADTSAQGFAHRLCALGVPQDEDSIRAHAALLYAGMLRGLPVSCRLWYADIRDKSTVNALEKYTSAAVSAGLMAAEYAAVEEMAKGLDRFEKFSVRANPTSREVVATMEVEDGHMLELVVKLPLAMPLKAPEAECRRSVGVSDARLRKWLLSITAFLRNRNGAVASALKLWKRNVDNEFEGHEDCLICFSIIQPSTGQLPRMACRTCRKKFHGVCLFKWFHSSGKSTCPHCQSPW